MNRVHVFLPCLVLLALTFGLPLPTYHVSYSKFAILCLFVAGGAVGLWVWSRRAETQGSDLSWRAGSALPANLGSRLSVLVRAWPFRLLLALMAWSVLSVSWAGSYEAWRWSVLFLLVHVAWAVIVFAWAHDSDRAKVVVACYLMAALAASVVGIVAFAHNAILHPTLRGEPTHRLMAPLGNPNFMAGFLITPLMVVIVHLIARAKGLTSACINLESIRSLLSLSLAGALLCIAFYLTGSRGGSLGLVSAFLAFLLFKMGQRARLIVLSCVLGVIILGTAVVMAFPGLRQWIGAEALVGTNVTRSMLWGDAERMIMSRPVLGWGAGGFCAFQAIHKLPQAYLFDYLQPMAISAHNEILEIGVEYGLLGMALYIAFIFSLVVDVLVNPRLRDSGPAVQAAVFGFIGMNVQSFFDVGLRFWDLAPFFWLLVGLLLAEGQRGGKNLPSEQRPFCSAGQRLVPAFLVLAALALLWVAAMDLVGEMNLRQGSTLQRRRQYVQACEAYRAALRRLVYFPDRINARMYLSECLHKTGRVKEAIATLEDLSRVAPNVRRSSLKLGLLYLQVAHQQARSEQERAECLEKAVSYLKGYLKTNADPEGYIALARALTSQLSPDYKTAADLLRTSIVLAPDLMTPRRLLVACLRKMKENRLALAEAQAIVERDKAQPLDVLELADILQESGKRDLARESLQDGLKRFPNDPDLREALRRLK